MPNSRGGKMRAAVPPPDAYQPRRFRRARLRAARRRFAAVCVLAAIVLAVVWIAHLFAPHPKPAVVVEPTPRPPAFASTFIRGGSPLPARQTREIAGIAAGVFGNGNYPASTSVVIEDARSGARLYTRNANGALTPASVLKLVVAATALRDLGPAYRFKTRFVTAQAPHGNAITGPLWFVGGGDPELTSADLRREVAAMRASGIVRIEGDVIADGSLFGPDEVNPTWAPDDLEYGYAALTSAVTMDGGTAQFTITPNANGGAANVHVDPDSIAGDVVGSIRTASSDAQNTLRIDPLPDGGGFQVAGEIPYGAPQKYWRSLSNPTQSAAIALKAMLVKAGIAVGGDATVGTAPKDGVAIWTKESRPLTAIIRRMMFDSDNHIAEQLLRSVGAQRFGVGTLADGLAAERDHLQEIGVPGAGQGLADGSGLSPANRIDAQTVATVLRELVSGPDAAQIAGLLPRVGMDGTVHVRNLAPDARGRVLGKDGYIEGVSSLAGYVKTAHHGVVIYAFLVNGWEHGLDSVWAGEDGLLSRLSRY